MLRIRDQSRSITTLRHIMRGGSTAGGTRLLGLVSQCHHFLDV